MRRFDILRACFYILAIVILFAMLETLIALLGCSWLIVVKQMEPKTVCDQFGTMIRDVITEALTSVLALLVASRPRPPDDDDPEAPA
jgi:hypothetical protein